MDELTKRRNLDVYIKNQPRVRAIIEKKELNNEDLVMRRLLLAKNVTSEGMMHKYGIQDLARVICNLRKKGEDIRNFRHTHWSFSRYKRKPITHYYLGEYDEEWVRHQQNFVK